MRHLKRLAVFALHLCTAVLTQASLLRLLLRESEPSFATMLAHMLPAAAACLADLILCGLLLRGQTMGRTASMALHFWDLILAFPVLILGFFGMLSGGNGAAFASCVLVLDLLLVIERSTAFVLFAPWREK